MLSAMKGLPLSSDWRKYSDLLWWLFMVALLMLASGVALRAAEDKPADAHTVPVIDGDVGPCSAEFTVKDRTGAPVYAAKIRVRIAYGFAGAHKLDLEVGTNIDGKARFEGLPRRVKRSLLYEASQGDREGSAVYDPADNCKAEHVIVIAKPDSSPSQQ
jgi:hypothetical protein